MKKFFIIFLAKLILFLLKVGLHLFCVEIGKIVWLKLKCSFRVLYSAKFVGCCIFFTYLFNSHQLVQPDHEVLLGEAIVSLTFSIVFVVVRANCRPLPNVSV